MVKKNHSPLTYSLQGPRGEKGVKGDNVSSLLKSNVRD